jgi:hypothetical protein
VRIHFRPTEHLVHAVDQSIGYDVLEQFRFLVHFVPAEPHHLHEEQLDESVAA